MIASDGALHCREFRLPRRGHSLEECEDASAALSERGRFAIADGAAESSCAALWARLLVDDFVRRSERQLAWMSWLPPLQERWATLVGRPADAPALPWYLENVRHRGAFATFLGVVVEKTGWYAQGVGDSCVFQVRDDILIQAFPLHRAADFGNTPWLVGSRAPAGETTRPQDATLQGVWRGGDRLWLMTDALAQWFLRQVETGERPWRILDGFLDAPADAFVAWIEAQRDARQLRNDDVTLVAVCL